MHKRIIAALAALIAGTAAGQSAERPDPLDPKAPVARIEYRSAFEGYRAFADEEIVDWRKANDDVREAGGHAGHKPGQGPGTRSSKPQPGSPATSGRPQDQGGHGAHR